MAWKTEKTKNKKEECKKDRKEGWKDLLLNITTETT